MKLSNKAIAASSLLVLAGLSSQVSATDEAFTASMTLLAPIVITESNALSFIDTPQGSPASVVTLTTDAIAAKFTATGTASKAVTGSVVESSIIMTTGVGTTTPEQITVDTFTTGGDMSGAGAATFDGSGDLSNLKIGATANVEAEDVAGDYTGTATFRLVYQ